MTKNKTIDNNTLDLEFVRHRRYEDFSMVPTKPYESKEIRCATDLWPLNGYFFLVDNIPSENLELIRDIGFRMFKVDEKIALVIDAYGLNHDRKYFLPLYELLVSNGVVYL